MKRAISGFQVSSKLGALRTRARVSTAGSASSSAQPGGEKYTSSPFTTTEGPRVAVGSLARDCAVAAWVTSAAGEALTGEALAGAGEALTDAGEALTGADEAFTGADEAFTGAAGGFAGAAAAAPPPTSW